jgi:hypothetical protein
MMGIGIGPLELLVLAGIGYLIYRYSKRSRETADAAARQATAAAATKQRRQAYEQELASWKQMEADTVVNVCLGNRQKIADCGGVEGALLIQRDAYCEEMQGNLDTIRNWVERLRAAWEADDMEEVDQCNLGLARMVGWAGGTLWALKEVDSLLRNEYARDTAAFERRWHEVMVDAPSGAYSTVSEVMELASSRLAAEGIALPSR